MNWRRGLFRLWLMTSMAWLGSITAIAYHFGAFEMLPPPPVGFTFSNPFADIRLFPIFALAPPLAVGAAVLALCWIVSGFSVQARLSANGQQDKTQKL
jgi:hypothetical protein